MVEDSHDIPLIDITRLGDLHPASVAAVDSACRDIGFMYVVGHGIPQTLIEETRRAVLEYFARPMAEKLKDSITRDNYRGYIPLGFFSPATEAAAADNYEGYKLHYDVKATDPIRKDCDLYGPNKWPADSDALRAAVTAYWSECDRVCGWILGALATSLGVPGEQLLQAFEYPLTNMTLLHYPPQPESSTGFGIHPHKDTDALTILAADPVGGLMVRRRNGAGWIHAMPPDDALVINIGDLLELWSGGYFVSTPHKVVNRSGRDRISFPWFAVPSFDTVVAPLREPHAGFSRSPVPVGDVSREVWRSNWLDVVPVDQTFDLGTLAD